MWIVIIIILVIGFIIIRNSASSVPTKINLGMVVYYENNIKQGEEFIQQYLYLYKDKISLSGNYFVGDYRITDTKQNQMLITISCIHNNKSVKFTFNNVIQSVDMEYENKRFTFFRKETF